MSQATRKEFTTPVGRIVAGDLYTVNTKDSMGQPLVVKNGPNRGQPRSEVYFALAIAKGGEQHWAQTAWGQIIYQTGAAAFPGGQYQNPAFSWKITDGDSQVPNNKGFKPCDREGYRGHWVLNFSSGFKPKIVTADGSQEIAAEGAVKPGFFVQVHAYVDGNNNAQNAGVYLNHMAVALAGYGPEIQTRGVDTTAVGFGQGVQLPPGASTVPIGALPGAPGSALPGSMPYAAPGMQPGMMPGMTPGALPAGLPPAMPVQTAGALTVVPGAFPGQPMATYPGQPPAGYAAPQLPVQPVMPNAGMTQIALPPGAMQPAAPVVRPPQQRMTALAQAPYEQYLGAGWTDQMLVQHGLMTPQ